LACGVIGPAINRRTVEQIAAQALYRAEGYRETGRGRPGRFEVIYFAKSYPR
jgi:hypothetical protein